MRFYRFITKDGKNDSRLLGNDLVSWILWFGGGECNEENLSDETASPRFCACAS
jgi:hypothetical protein